jgi:hypothetical protein
MSAAAENSQVERVRHEPIAGIAGMKQVGRIRLGADGFATIGERASPE